MVRAELTVTNSQGIHLRPANTIANVAEKYKATIHFKKNHMDVNAKSIINLVSGSFRQGDKLICECNGPDEKLALEAMRGVLAQDLDDKDLK
ncbi:MAG: HPr family phosphocarrier protein [Clostridiales bacterium]|nr:HPr family phosphocarrier protein [Clostridiales bacterium]